MQIWPVNLIRNHGIVAVLITGILSMPAFGSGNFWILAPALAAGIGYFYFATRRFFRRRQILREPFPSEWRVHLEKYIPFYRGLDTQGRGHFETDVRIFLQEQYIYGLRGESVSDEIRVLIAASAAILGFGLPDWDWPVVRDILVYPTAFDEDYDIQGGNPLAGIVHQQGPIIFSQRDLKHGFCKPADGLHVGIHELAHVLDMATGAADGIPAGLKWVATAPWIRIMSDRLQKVQKGEIRKVLRPYAGVNAAEFFAVAVEAFFEKPRELKKQDSDLYDVLSRYFNQDTAAARLPVTDKGGKLVDCE